uniref:Vesicle transport protein n=1 Tax=Ascaris lumbricoides TaxID=6252 RepID=A0A0M3ITJ1_ASCLU
MLFISNPRPVDCATECDEEERKPDNFTERWDITKVVICGVFLYVLTSMFSIILYYPVSLISLIFPSIVLLYTVLALRGDKRQNLWFCIFAGFAGFALKISAIIVFFMMFPIGQEEPRLRTSSIKELSSIKGLYFYLFLCPHFCAHH